MCRAMEEMREQARKEGRQEARQSLAQKLLDFGGLTPEDISRLSELPLEEIHRLRDARPQ